MKKTTLIVLMGALVAFFAFPSFTSTSEQKASSEKTKVVDPDTRAINLENTLTAYKADIAANSMYTAYSEKAKKEGHHEVALLFRAISKSTGIHAKNHMAILKNAGQSVPEVEPEFALKSTNENLKEAIALETYQVNKMYPQFVICANQAQNQPCHKNMCCAYLISKKHKVFLEKALEALENHNVDLLSEVYFVCPRCGNTYENNVHQFCQFCNTPYWKYTKISD